MDEFGQFRDFEGISDDDIVYEDDDEVAYKDRNGNISSYSKKKNLLLPEGIPIQTRLQTLNKYQNHHYPVFDKVNKFNMSNEELNNLWNNAYDEWSKTFPEKAQKYDIDSSQFEKYYGDFGRFRRNYDRWQKKGLFNL